MTDRVKQILLAARPRLAADLETASVHAHSTPRGTATEHGWGKFLGDHLPRRYEVTQGFVVDRTGQESQQIDLIICDRHFTSVLCDDRAARYVPAESVYAVFEVKQSLSKRHLEAAQEKVRSVRRLERSSAPIPHAGGTHPPKSPVPILGGLLAAHSEWTPAFGDPLQAVLAAASPEARLDLLVGLDVGATEARHAPDGAVVLEVCQAPTGLPWFFLTLVHRLQERGSVSAVDYLSYRAVL